MSSTADAGEVSKSAEVESLAVVFEAESQYTLPPHHYPHPLT